MDLMITTLREYYHTYRDDCKYKLDCRELTYDAIWLTVKHKTVTMIPYVAKAVHPC